MGKSTIFLLPSFNLRNIARFPIPRLLTLSSSVSDHGVTFGDVGKRESCGLHSYCQFDICCVAIKIFLKVYVCIFKYDCMRTWANSGFMNKLALSAKTKRSHKCCTERALCCPPTIEKCDWCPLSHAMKTTPVL